MKTEIIALLSPAPGTQQTLQVQRYGTPGASPKVYIQGALHADEVPAILVTQQLARRFTELESQGAIQGEIVLVPCANPIGLAQHNLGQHQGRFDLRDGGNFNRGFADLAELVKDNLRPQLGPNSTDNTKAIRSALRAAAQGLHANNTVQDLKNTLLQLAVDADIVLDLHCDTDAVMHVYALTPQAELAEQLGAALGAQAVLLATESGGTPFDEACSRPWLVMQEMFPEFPVELACFGATVELRGEADTSHVLAKKDALALCDFLSSQGVLRQSSTIPSPLCSATPLSGSEPITAPHAGVVVFHCTPGDVVVAGDLIADLVDAATGAITPLVCKSGGVLYGRCGQRWAQPGKRLAKIAGTSLARTGKLLSP